MAKQSTTSQVGLEMANPASAEGMGVVFQSYIPLLPTLPLSGVSQPTVLWCDQNFFERGEFKVS